MTKYLVAAAAVTLLLAADSTEAGQAAAVDSRWLPWIGCWQLSEEQFETPDALRRSTAETEAGALIGRTAVCVEPADEGITLKASDGNRLLVERRLVADGTRRDVVEDDCRGWERSEWSRDGYRLFTTAELRCADAPPRRVTGVSLMSSASSWVDIQFVDVGQHQQLEVRRYAPMQSSEGDGGDPGPETGTPSFDPSEVRRARRESAEAPVLLDVMEASAKTTPRVVEALLVETEPDLNLDRRSLIALDDAGIDHDVIDLLVALSYPERFVVERRDQRGSWSSNAGGYGGFGGFYDPVWYSDLYPYYVTPLGSRYWGGGYSPYLYGSAVASPFVILPSDSENQPEARAVRGRGYTRIRPRAGDGSQGTVVSRGASSGGSGSSTRTGSSSGSSGTTTAAPGGYSKGGSGTGRRAVPRQ